MTNLIVCDVTIKQDDEGRYCLNDLHKAAGELKHQQPAKFLANKQTKEMVSEIGDHAKNVILGRGKAQGTYVVKELVYAYAMWISPKFNLEVIRAYDRLATDGVAVHYKAAEAVLDDPLSYMEKIIGQAKQLKAERDRLAAENQELTPKAVVFDHCMALREETLANFVRSLKGLNTNAIKGDLAKLGYLYRLSGSGKYRVYSKYRDKLFVEKMIAHETHPTYEILPTAEGKKLIVDLYKQGKLTMKKAYVA